MAESLSWDDLVNDAGDVGSFEAIPDGPYDMEVKDAKFKPTKAGKKMYEVTTKVVGGPHANRQIWDNLVVSPDSPGALNYFFRKMAALGLNKDYFKTNPSDEAIVQALKGRRFRAQVGHETYKGEKKNRIEKYFSANEGSAAPAPGNSAPPAAAPPLSSAPAPAPAAAPPAPAAAPAPAPAAAPAPAPAEPAAPAPAPAAPAAPAPAPAAPAEAGTPAVPPPPASPF